MDYEALRKNYKPNKITALFIAESPPAPKSNRFFYLEGVTKADTLYLETMRVLFPEMTSKLTAKQIRANKAFYLTAFKDKGFYLIDGTDTPIAGMSKSRKLSTLAHDTRRLQEKVRGLVTADIPIVELRLGVRGVPSEDVVLNLGRVVAVAHGQSTPETPGEQAHRADGAR